MTGLFSSLNSDWLIDVTSYASQQVFLFNGNFEENICLGKGFDDAWFENVMEMSGAGELLTLNATPGKFSNRSVWLKSFGRAEAEDSAC